jgi:hypothetical protein
VISQLPPSRYRLTAEMHGFRTYVLDGLPAAQQQATVNVVLEVGTVSQQTTVEATPQLVESSTATLSAVVSNERIVHLPLNERNIYSLTLSFRASFSREQPAAWTIRSTAITS